MKRLVLALLTVSALIVPAHAAPLGICTVDAHNKVQSECLTDHWGACSPAVLLLTRPGGTMGFVALEDGTQVRVGDIYGRNWVYVETFVNTREGTGYDADGWVKRSDLKCTGGDNFPPPLHLEKSE